LSQSLHLQRAEFCQADGERADFQYRPSGHTVLSNRPLVSHQRPQFAEAIPGREASGSRHCAFNDPEISECNALQTFAPP
jgi:hypothetical protein